MKNSCPSKEYLHRDRVRESNRLRHRGSSGRASRRLPFLRIDSSAVRASRLIRRRGGWWARRGATRRASE